MNKRGQSILFGIVFGIILFIIGMIFLNFITPLITTARNSDNLDCADTTISDGNKLTCLIVDLTIIQYSIAILATAGGVATARFIK